MMRLAICAASRLPRPWMGQAFTAAPPAALRYSSNTPAGNTELISAQSTSADSTSADSTSADSTSADSTSADSTSTDDFVKQVIGTTNSLGTRDGEYEKSSSNVAKKAKSRNVVRKVKSVPPWQSSGVVRKVQARLIRKVQSEGGKAEDSSSIVDSSPPTKSKITKTAFPLIRKATVGSPDRPWRLPSKLWPEKPAAVFPRRGLLTLRGLPLETTLRDIVLAIDHAARNGQLSRRTALTSDIVIKPSLDKSTDVDAVVDFTHPDGPKHFQDLAMKGEFKVCGVVPTTSLDGPEVLQASESDEVIAQLSKVERAEYFTSPEQRKVVRRTHIIYN